MIVSTILNLYVIPVLYVFDANLTSHRSQPAPPARLNGASRESSIIEATETAPA